MEKRLLLNALHSQLLLLWYSFISVAVAVYYLGGNNLSVGAESKSNIVWIVFSIMVLCVSGFINGLSFKERAAASKVCYRKLSVIHQKTLIDGCDIDRLESKYFKVINKHENHLTVDYFKALCVDYLVSNGKKCDHSGIKEGMDRKPTIYQFLFFIFVWLRRFMMFIMLYILPVIIFFAFESLYGNF